MRRRSVVRALGSLSLAVGMSGCLERLLARKGSSSIDENGELRVTDITLRLTNSACYEERTVVDPPTVDVGETIEIEGRLVTPSPCYEPTVRWIEYTQIIDTLEIAIGTVPTDGNCAACVGLHTYEMAIEFTGTPPDDVRVIHDSQSGYRNIL